MKRDDLLAHPSSVKSQAIGRLGQRGKFQDISRAMRKELVGIDGATILTCQGEILAVGAIIKISGAIKISADGMVKVFYTVEGGKTKVAFR